MPESPLLAELAQIVRSVARIAPEVAVGPETRLVDDLGVDSLDLVGISMKVEDRYGLSIDVDEVPNFVRLADLAQYIDRHRTATAA